MDIPPVAYVQTYWKEKDKRASGLLEKRGRKEIRKDIKNTRKNMPNHGEQITRKKQENHRADAMLPKERGGLMLAWSNVILRNIALR